MAGEIYEGEVGTIIDVDMRANISGATDVTLIITKPDRTNDVWLPVIFGLKMLRYTSLKGDLITGLTQIQPHLTLGSWTDYGKPVFITVQRVATR